MRKLIKSTFKCNANLTGPLGFSLIELMIVVAIIGILSSIAAVQFSEFRIRTYNAEAKQASRSLAQAAQLLKDECLENRNAFGCDSNEPPNFIEGTNEGAKALAQLSGLTLKGSNNSCFDVDTCSQCADAGCCYKALRFQLQGDRVCVLNSFGNTSYCRDLNSDTITEEKFDNPFSIDYGCDDYRNILP